jgi:uracil-DNA glycosylase family 4
MPRRIRIIDKDGKQRRWHRTPYFKHYVKWHNCKRCDLCNSRKNVVLARGSLPCDVLFVGEAPGASEDVIGVPFVGPAGKVLDQIIDAANGSLWKIAFSNLLACIPKDGTGNKIQTSKEIPKEYLETCFKRLEELIVIAQPQTIVCVGTLAKSWIETGDYRTGISSIIHPAAILRMDISQKGLAIQRTIITLRDMFEALLPF